LIAQQNPATASRSRYLYLLFTTCFLSGMLGATISTLMPTLLPEVIKDLKGDMAPEEIEKAGAVINAMFLYGWMFGGFCWGMISDRSGRKNTVVFSTACYAAFALLTVISPSWQWLVLFRFLSGFGVGGVIVTTTIIISEAWIPSRRSVAIGLLTICFPVGVFLSGAITYWFSDWLHSFLVSVFPLALSVIGHWILEEPEVKNEASSNPQKENLKALFSDAHIKNILVGSVTFGAMLIGLWAIFSWLPTYVQQLIVNSDGQKERSIAMMSLAGAALVGGSLSGWFIRLAGWKISMLLCFAACFIASFFLFKFTSSFSWLIYLESGILGFFFGVSQGILSDYISKVFPAPIRATATGFCFNAGRLFTATVVFFVGWLVNTLGGYGNSIFTFSFVFLLGFAATLLIREKPPTDS